jgi:hypothetical protein
LRTRSDSEWYSAVRAHNEVVGCFDGKLLDTERRMGDLGVAGGSSRTT